MPTTSASRRSAARVACSRALAYLAAPILAVLSACDRGVPVGPREDAGLGAPRRAVSAAATATATTPAYHFYVHAHQDDWQLFMGDRVDHSFKSGATVVLVYTTAGDAGNLMTDGGRYFETREAAAQASVDAITPSGTWACAQRTIGSHPIRRCTKSSAPVVSYYMRMPDGNTTGGGFGAGSLDILRDKATAVKAADGSTTYTSWADFTATVRGIVVAESNGGSAPNVEVNSPDHDRTLNPGDHPDHYATADAVRAARTAVSWNLNWYVDYDTYWGGRPVNLDLTDQGVKKKAFKAYDDVMAAGGYGSVLSPNQDPMYVGWLERTYLRSDPATGGGSVPVVPPSALTATSTTAKGTRTIKLTWTPGGAANVDIWRSGTKIAETIGNTGSYTDTIKKNGTLTYEVCVAGPTRTACSNVVTVTK